MDWSSLGGREGDGDQLTLGRGTARTSGLSVGGWADVPSRTSCPPPWGPPLTATQKPARCLPGSRGPCSQGGLGWGAQR